jgi:hypothetical protein
MHRVIALEELKPPPRNVKNVPETTTETMPKEKHQNLLHNFPTPVDGQELSVMIRGRAYKRP